MLKKSLLISISIIMLLILFNNLAKAADELSRAHNLYREIKCIVCANQPISESNSEMAKNIRLLINLKIQEGLTDDEIKEFLIKRYGQQIIFAPPIDFSTYFLWFTPFIILIIGFLKIVNIPVNKLNQKNY